MGSPSCSQFVVAWPCGESLGPLDSFLSRVWYRVIRRRVRPRVGAGVERSCGLPLLREQIALVILSLADGKPFTPVQIQKALFLASDKVASAFATEYTFQPYDYGPFDWQVYADIEELAKEVWPKSISSPELGGEPFQRPRPE